MHTSATSPERPSGDYKTDYYVLLRGTLRQRGERVLIITNGARVARIELKLSQFLLLFVLAAFARHEAGLASPPIKIQGGAFLEPNRILAEIAGLNSREPDLDDRAILTAYDIYRAKWDIRRRIRAANLHPELLESYPRAGSRLSTPPERIQIALFDEDGTMTWGSRRKDGNG